MSKWYRCYLKSDGNMYKGGTPNREPRKDEWIYSSPDHEDVYHVYRDAQGNYNTMKYNPGNIHDKTFKVHHFPGKQERYDIYDVIDNLYLECVDKRVEEIDPEVKKKKVRRKKKVDKK